MQAKLQLWFRLDHHSAGTYVQRCEIEGRSPADGGDLGVQTLTLSMKVHRVSGILLERIITGTRRWSGESRESRPLRNAKVHDMVERRKQGPEWNGHFLGSRERSPLHGTGH
jgi:hypothetical protein